MAKILDINGQPLSKEEDVKRLYFNVGKRYTCRLAFNALAGLCNTFQDAIEQLDSEIEALEENIGEKAPRDEL